MSGRGRGSSPGRAVGRAAASRDALPPTTDSFPLEDYLAREGERVEAALARALRQPAVRLPPGVASAVEHGVLSGGKRLRPILLAAAYRAAGGTGGPTALYDLAVSVELIHAYSLMHDDLPCMDDAELRRGRPTTHRVHGGGVTVRAGLALIPLAAARVLTAGAALGLDPERGRMVAALLLRAAGAAGMVGGQALDLLGEERTLGVEALNELHRHKTGALLRASLEMGAVAAGAPPAVRRALVEYGDAVGLAFQVADDVLDATATAAELGKEPSDQALGKSTYVSLYGLEEARRRGQALVRDALAALAGGGVEAPPLEALARYVMARSR
ncbi:MAG: polyprenyl synthetase family protein [Longimicrobiales bacterium]|nr:polyprenyl synthetase family protein [Longimicrobiales bacterium]